MKNIDHLIRMANDIGNFFDALPDRQEGVASVADHIKKFWAPRMRVALLEFLAENPDGRLGDVALSDIAKQAMTDYRDMLMPELQA